MAHKLQMDFSAKQLFKKHQAFWPNNLFKKSAWVRVQKIEKTLLVEASSEIITLNMFFETNPIIIYFFINLRLEKLTGSIWDKKNWQVKNSNKIKVIELYTFTKQVQKMCFLYFRGRNRYWGNQASALVIWGYDINSKGTQMLNKWRVQ